MHVSGERYAALQALRAVYPIPDVFTQDEAEAQVKAVTENYLVKPSRLPLPWLFKVLLCLIYPPGVYWDGTFKTLRGYIYIWGVFVYGRGNRILRPKV